jgi:hypothetical protein
LEEEDMGYYKVLSRPCDYSNNTEYKGLYRSGPLPKSDINQRFMSLWYRYVEHLEPLINLGITTELTLDELKEFADLAIHETGDCFEVIFFSEYAECPHKSEYYGVDVAGFGWYSMVGEGLPGGGSYHLYNIICEYFRGKLNAYGLFSLHDDAVSFLTALVELEKLYPGLIMDGFEFRVFHIFKVII